MNTRWDDIGYVKRSNNRIIALNLLVNPKMPSELAKEMKVSLTHSSKIIRELNSRQLIKCLNEKMKVGRMYHLTEKGRNLLKDLK